MWLGLGWGGCWVWGDEASASLEHPICSGATWYRSQDGAVEEFIILLRETVSPTPAQGGM